MEEDKHLDVVWEIEWVKKPQKSGCNEQLMSISSDGKVNEWNIKKGLECSELKLIAHQPNPIFKSHQAQFLEIKTNQSSLFISWLLFVYQKTPFGLIWLQKMLIPDEKLMKNENFRYSAGYSMTFHKKDENIYFIGTEEGAIHRCSKSYKEQYLDSYYGHTGAVYKVSYPTQIHPMLILKCQHMKMPYTFNTEIL